MSNIEFDKKLSTTSTSIKDLVVYELPVHGDNRGWFKENWQREKMTTIGLPDFGPVQNNVSFNAERGVTRGLHAEPWDKFVSIGNGSVFGVWCDLRANSPTYGSVFTALIDPSKAVYVPRGVANGFQALENNTVYMYLVNDHWSPDANYSFVSMFDKSLGIDWPIPLAESEISDKDKNHPILTDATPIKPKKTLITGASGQLGRALRSLYPDAECTSRDTLDISSPEVLAARHWKDYDLILNAAAYTTVDLAETDGRSAAWNTNAIAAANLSQIARDNRITLIHISSDYVFDGTKDIHTEDEPLTPLSVYGQTKAAGDISVSTAPRHYIIRTSWVVGGGNNFVRAIQSLAERDIKPNVVYDQIGRLTFASDLANGIKHLINSGAPFGTYNITNTGDPVSLADVAAEVYELSGKPRDDIKPVTTRQYYTGKEGIAPRPLQSTLKLDKIEATGFIARDWRDALREYIQQ